MAFKIILLAYMFLQIFGVERRKEEPERIFDHPALILQDASFKDGLGTDGNGTTNGKWFIKFWAPWCPHCRHLSPTWNELADTLYQNSDVRIAKVDCTIHQHACDYVQM